MMGFFEFWYSHAPIFAILIPAFTAFILVLLGNPGAGALTHDWRQPWRRGLSLLSVGLGLATAINYLLLANTGQITVYQLSEWSAPFGIVLVLDRLSAMMLLLTYTLAAPVLWFASKGWDARGRFFHAMSHFLLMGLSGAFLTGDLFNLFVFFEILLMASYVLLIHAQGKPRFQLGIHYVSINLLASALFLIGLGIIYGSVGSLNMADVTRIMPTLPIEQHRLATAGSLLLFVVFGIKAAMLPLGFWLPKTYAVASTPVAALFTIMTKVGIYAILRVNGTVFQDELSQDIFSTWLLPIALLTSLYGALGALVAARLRRFVGFMVLSSVGTILIALSMMNTAAWAAALYYLVHSTLIAAAFYLLCGWITSQRGEHTDHLYVAPKMKQAHVVSLCFFAIALMMAGLPPFSGFWGKVLILGATAQFHAQAWVIAIVLLVSLISILAFTRAGFVLFWQASAPEDDPQEKAYAAYQKLPEHAPPRNDKAIYLLLSALVIYVVCAAPIFNYVEQTAIQLKNSQQYIDTILKQDQQGEVISVQPFDPNYVPETKYNGEQADPYAQLIPDLVSEDTWQGPHISPYKKQQAEQQNQQANTPDQAQLNAVEP
ncbi:monovalent cation/H+ antiporter subunit D [Acinetobacter rudis]|uniref:Monovalent cation/H+ antiporter subunit D n=1 Tax=Acinetobacter rudis TaxID=632955 RepID=A0AAW8J628_9GAMM|nr:monovalent cation/H+ antiporter subunit D [Acinetobacter rudis]MDQ8935180.1 monovalent cation/H+ antiporter subunit D [Acinetobacter rudis]MDQ9017048.1 monovalent cation/H+ antiporter subunit D [Acinetobacter rudis]